MTGPRQKKWLHSLRRSIKRASCQRSGADTCRSFGDDAARRPEEKDEEIEEHEVGASTSSTAVHAADDVDLGDEKHVISPEAPEGKEETALSPPRESPPPAIKETALSREEAAAIRIQACFRGHLARRACRALRGLVKLQAMARGAHVRGQARAVTRCMEALVRLQMKMRERQARQLLPDTAVQLVAVSLPNKDYTI